MVQMAVQMTISRQALHQSPAADACMAQGMHWKHSGSLKPAVRQLDVAVQGWPELYDALFKQAHQQDAEKAFFDLQSNLRWDVLRSVLDVSFFSFNLPPFVSF